MRVLLVVFMLLVPLPTVSALSQDGTERLIRDVGWTYDQFWIYFDVAGNDIFGLENATAVPVAMAVDNQTARLWPVAFVPIDWAFLVVDCAGIVVFGGTPIDAVSCVLRAPGPDLAPVNDVIAASPSELQQAAIASFTSASMGASTATGNARDTGEGIAVRWATDVRALIP